jgi:hypothetical protein
MCRDTSLSCVLLSVFRRDVYFVYSGLVKCVPVDNVFFFSYPDSSLLSPETVRSGPQSLTLRLQNPF